MYDFSGILYLIKWRCGISLIMGLLCLFFAKPWEKGLKNKETVIAVIMIVFSICLGSIYTSRILSPNVSCYKGIYIEERPARFQFSMEYVFWDGVGLKQPFDLDVFSKRKVFPDQFQLNKEYTVYYDEFTRVIVKVES